MANFIVDANLPYRIQLFKNPEFVSAIDLGLAQNDFEIWNYAKANNLTVISRDVDFYQLLLQNRAPPKLVWFRVHYLSVKETSLLFNSCWPEVDVLLNRFSLVEIHRDHLVADIPSL
jgi:predicted nuclease of predicted toxin-antitoxin system